MELFQKILSYVWPFTKHYHSSINGALEVSWINGKKHLNSRNANYSYGKLQQVLEFGLDEIGLSNQQNILVLGMGGGSVISSLRQKFHYSGKITAVEIDPAIIEIATAEYNIKESNRLTIIEADAERFVANCTEAFDLIIVDLFVDDLVLNFCFEPAFWRNIDKILQVNGNVLFNAGMNSKQAAGLELIQIELDKLFHTHVYTHVLGENTLIIASSKN